MLMKIFFELFIFWLGCTCYLGGMVWRFLMRQMASARGTEPKETSVRVERVPSTEPKEDVSFAMSSPSPSCLEPEKVSESEEHDDDYSFHYRSWDGKSLSPEKEPSWLWLGISLKYTFSSPRDIEFGFSPDVPKGVSSRGERNWQRGGCRVSPISPIPGTLGGTFLASSPAARPFADGSFEFRDRMSPIANSSPGDLEATYTVDFQLPRRRLMF